MNKELMKSANNSFVIWNDLGVLLADATAVAAHDDADSNALVAKMLGQYHQARVDGMPEAKRLRGMFGAYHDSDWIAKQLQDEITRREGE